MPPVDERSAQGGWVWVRELIARQDVICFHSQEKVLLTHHCAPKTCSARAESGTVGWLGKANTRQIDTIASRRGRSTWRAVDISFFRPWTSSGCGTWCEITHSCSPISPTPVQNATERRLQRQVGFVTHPQVPIRRVLASEPAPSSCLAMPTSESLALRLESMSMFSVLTSRCTMTGLPHAPACGW